jgi:diamine N-acetyltransferase
MGSDLNIRFANLHDAELLARLGWETFHDAFVDHPMMPVKDLNIYLAETFTVARIAEELADPYAIHLLAEMGDEPAGYAKLEVNSRAREITAINPIKLKRLYSKQKYIGFGVGAVLMERCLAEAIKRNHDTIWLTVWENNLRAQNFYRKWKFDPCGFIEFRLGKALLTDVLMQRHLGVNGIL